jgi:hypothetical protein
MLVTVNCSASPSSLSRPSTFRSVKHPTFPNRGLCCAVKSCARLFYAPRSVSGVEAKSVEHFEDDDDNDNDRDVKIFLFTDGE